MGPFDISSDPHSPTALVVDPDPGSARRTTGLLRRIGCQTTSVASARAARRYLRAVSCALVLVDSALGSEGATLLSDLRAEGFAGVVVGTSRQADDLPGAGGQPVLRRPFSVEQLRVLLQTRVQQPRRLPSPNDLLERAEAQAPPPGAVLAPLLSSAPRNLSAVIEALDRDPSLAAEVILRANTGRQRGPAPITTLRAAAGRLGPERLLALGVEAMLGGMHRAVGRPGELLAAMWANTQECAEVTRSLACTRQTGRLNPEGMHLAALLHNVGETELVRAAISLAWPMDAVGLAALESVAVGEHERLGNRVLSGWGVPVDLLRAAGSHHRQPRWPESTEDRDDRKLILLGWHTALARGHGYWPSHPEVIQRGDPKAAMRMLSAALGVPLASSDPPAEASRSTG